MMNIENFKKEKITFDIVMANIYAVLMIVPIAIVYGVPFYFLWSDIFTKEAFVNVLDNPLGTYVSSTLIVFILGIIVHELIHGITWAIFADKGFKSIKFGVMWKMLTPYCHCKEPLLIKQYLLGAIMPAIILGVIPAVISMFTGSIALLVFGAFFTLAAGGDFIMVNLLRNEKMNDLVQDHPSEMGCYIYREKGDDNTFSDPKDDKEYSSRFKTIAVVLGFALLFIPAMFLGYYLARYML